MGPLRRKRLLIAAGALCAALAATTACDPAAAGGLNSTAVALTTDQTGTKALERAGVKVQWLSCTSQVGERKPAQGAATANPHATHNVAAVDCRGQTTDGKDITLKGKVIEERNGRCVRGGLVARVEGRVVFEASVLGNCSAAPTPTQPPHTPPPFPTPSHTQAPQPTDWPRPTVTETVQPTHSPPDEPTTQPPETPPVTVTVTASPEQPDPGPTPCGCETPDPRDAGAEEHAR
ncbi:hypothetical protein [Streptomyces sp. ODS28]|uniref:hypothetical protein n=1 Tax=Streptomyces sp. ODS28 TaxID=3136688 RepID=UPI0031ECDD9E